MPRRNVPAWRRIICLDCIAIYGKGDEIWVPGYMVLLLIITLPIWCWFFLPYMISCIPTIVKQLLESQRRSYYCGLNVSEENTARPILWKWTPRFLCSDLMYKNSEASWSHRRCRIFDLPYEIREKIWLELLRPADMLFIRYDSKLARLYALPEKRLSQLVYVQQQAVCDTSCRDLSQLLKVNRKIYVETSEILYKANTFCFDCHTSTSTALSTDRSFVRMIAFCHSILPQRVAMLQHIRLNVEFHWSQNRRNDDYILRSGTIHNWKSVCNLLKQMSSLIDLHIKIHRSSYTTGTRTSGQRLPVHGQAPESKVLERLIGVKARKTFVVETHWPIELRGDLTQAAFDVKFVDSDHRSPIVSTTV